MVELSLYQGCWDDTSAVHGRQLSVRLLGDGLLLNQQHVVRIHSACIVTGLQYFLIDAVYCPEGVLVCTALHSRQALFNLCTAITAFGSNLYQDVSILPPQHEDHHVNKTNEIA